MNEDDLPYRVEYSKSARASCQVCKNNIAKDILRLATVVQSPFHDGKLVKWFHPNCFFLKQRPKSVGDIAHFDNIRWEDQESLRKKVEAANAGTSGAPVPSSSKGGRKRGKAKGNPDFSVEYAKSSRSKCRGCENTIVKGEVRIGKKDYESEDARKFGGLDRWHHVECFSKLRLELNFYEKGDTINGIGSLSQDDKKTVVEALPAIKQEDLPPPSKKVKAEPKDEEEEKIMKSQNKKLFSIRGHLDSLTKSELVELLEVNNQYVPTGKSEILDHLSDVMIFGALAPCKSCKGKFVYISGTGYRCKGSVSEWALCENTTQDPKRTKFSVPKELQEKYPFLAAYKCKVKRREFRITAPTSSSMIKKEDTIDGPKITDGPSKPLKHLDFVIIGKTSKSKEALTKEILLLGGFVRPKITPTTAAIISTKEEVEKMNSKMQDAEKLDIDVVTEDFVEEAKEFVSAPAMLIKKKSISPWGGDPAKRINEVVTEKSLKSKSQYAKSVSGKVKLKVKGGGIVDPESQLEDDAHVYQSGKDKFTVTLGITDIQTNKNSFYKMQILKHDKREKYWLFRSWGRIGTTIGGNKCDSMALEECMDKFKELYLEKSGNQWENRKHFKKLPKFMYPIDIDEGEEENTTKLLQSDIESKLKKPIQDLMKLIFDVSSMKKAMLEYEIDVDKMPLGKISKKQVREAYSILSNLLELIKNKNPTRSELIAASNQFYTLIPHNFGVDGAKIIETEEEVKIKSEMLESLLEMEIAYNLLHSKTDEKKNPLDAHYEQLKTEIDVLDKESEEFKIIEKYVKNTHAETHRQYELEIEDVFTVKRSGEASRYNKSYKKLHNKKLLWHGSRVTNYCGILSQGLRIAPPEAPVTGYMFGKGIYFADMVSKSANYCCTSPSNPTGLLLLCEVALGNTLERYNADYIEKLPKDKHSTWGKGKTMPDPEKSIKTKAGVEIPCGPAMQPDLPQKSSLLYNEFIVYDINQVKVEYVLKTKFKYKF